MTLTRFNSSKIISKWSDIIVMQLFALKSVRIDVLVAENDRIFDQMLTGQQWSLAELGITEVRCLW